MQTYTIQARLRDREGARWIAKPSFSHMSKSFADGAWAMLKAHTGGILEYRLVNACDHGEIYDEHRSEPVHVNTSQS